jgi:hypothetical protein
MAPKQFLPKSSKLAVIASIVCVFALTAPSGRAAVTWLFDFGAGTTPTTNGADPNDPANFWNNITPTIGQSDTGSLFDVVTTTNVVTDVDFLMISRFNGPNENGTTVSTVYADNATRDSLFGNTEVFGGFSNITPIFKFAALDPSLSYTFKFYASRTGVSDNRTTDYTVSGSVSGTASLNVANNINNFVTVSDIFPTAGGEITISLLPNAANNNSNHFTYLGVLEMQAVPEPVSGLMLGIGALALGFRRKRAS